jgi:uncharacterized protein (TIGR03437 family)
LLRISQYLVAVVGLAAMYTAPAAAQCNYILTPSSVHVSYQGAGSSSFTVTSSASNCTRPAKSNADWINVAYGQNGTGNGTVGYTVDSSNSPTSRTGTITVATATFTVNQDAYPCTYSFSPANLTPDQKGGNFSIALTTPCSWTATTSTPWIAITSGTSGNKNGTIAVAIQPNTAVASRTGSISINNQTYTVTQFGIGCSYIVSPASANFTSSAATSQISLETDASCPWTIQNPSPDWVTGLPASGSGPATLNYSVAANPSSQNRNAALTVAGQAVTISQAGVGIFFSSTSVVNGASFASGQIAPGELFTIFGSGLGPAGGAGIQLTPDGQYVTTLLAGTRVLFDGMPAPLTYVSNSQINAIVPFELAGAVSTKIQVEVQGVASSPVTIFIADSSPGIFTSPAGGSGQGAVLNQNNSANSPANPAAIGSVLQVFATGAGQTDPAGVDGLLAGDDPSIPVATVTAQIAGVDAPVEYAGSSSGLVAGVLQVNVQIPLGVPTGDAVPLTLKIGDNFSQQGVTVAIH